MRHLVLGTSRLTILRFRSRVLLGIGLALLAMLGVSVVSPATANAANTPCGGYFQKYNMTVQYCPVWVPSGGVPVFKSPLDHTVVGYLYHGGSSNWFGCESEVNGHPTNMYGYSSDWYAYTLSDNGPKGQHWGYVSGIFYAGSTPYFYHLNACV